MTKQEYLLICLMEELAEMQQAISKCLRFKPEDEYLEADTGILRTNLRKVIEEYSDVRAIMKLLEETKLSIKLNRQDFEWKQTELKAWMQRSKNLGVLDDNSDNRW
jgi:hypothetical protein